MHNLAILREIFNHVRNELNLSFFFPIEKMRNDLKCETQRRKNDVETATMLLHFFESNF